MSNDMTGSCAVKAAGNKQFYCNEFVAVKEGKKKKHD